MKKLFAFYVFVVMLITSCDSDPAPAPSPEPEVKTPAAAQLNLPENNKECEQGEVNGSTAMVDFSWNASADTDLYDLKITNLDTNVSSGISGLTTTTAEVNLERGHPYSWQVISKNSGAVSANSSTWKFYLAGDGESNFAPFPSDAVSPTPGATITPSNGKVNLVWKSVEDPDGDPVNYTIYADKVDGLQDPQESWKDLNQTSIEISVDANTVYYWRVITSDGNNSAASNIFTFKTSN